MGTNFSRIFIERGPDFFEKEDRSVIERKDVFGKPDAEEEKTEKEGSGDVKPMTPEELYEMRMELMPNLL